MGLSVLSRHARSHGAFVYLSGSGSLCTYDPVSIFDPGEAARQRQRAREEREEIKINPSSPWMGYTDEEGAIYYYREDTDESVWEEPRQGIRGWDEG